MSHLCVFARQMGAIMTHLGCAWMGRMRRMRRSPPLSKRGWDACGGARRSPKGGGTHAAEPAALQDRGTVRMRQSLPLSRTGGGGADAAEPAALQEGGGIGCVLLFGSKKNVESGETFY